MSQVCTGSVWVLASAYPGLISTLTPTFLTPDPVSVKEIGVLSFSFVLLLLLGTCGTKVLLVFQILVNEISR